MRCEDPLGGGGRRGRRRGDGGTFDQHRADGTRPFDRALSVLLVDRTEGVGARPGPADLVLASRPRLLGVADDAGVLAVGSGRHVSLAVVNEADVRVEPGAGLRLVLGLATRSEEGCSFRKNEDCAFFERYDRARGNLNIGHGVLLRDNCSTTNRGVENEDNFSYFFKICQYYRFEVVFLLLN